MGIGGQIVNTGATYGPAQTQFQYQVLLERAKQLAQIAGQMEGSMLSALEKYDAEQYSIKRAEQDLALAEESINLQDLRKDQAQLGVELANKQLERANVSSKQMDDWLSISFAKFHSSLLALYTARGILQTSQLFYQKTQAFGKAKKEALAAAAGAAALGAVGVGAAAELEAGARVGSLVIQGLINGINTGIEISSLKLSDRLRRQEWTYQKNLAEKDKEIARAQISIAKIAGAGGSTREAHGRVAAQLL